MKYEHLFSPYRIRGLELKNRVMIPGMVTKLAKQRHVTQELIDYHAARAAGGLGLNFVEATSVHAPSASSSFLSIAGDEYLGGMEKLTDTVHAAGGKIGIQLWQGGLVATMLDPTAEVVIPSEFRMQPMVVQNDAVSEDLVFLAATVEKLHEVTRAFGEAAARAVKAGFDAVELHAAHGYSTHVFLSAAFNQRTDEYGGSFENRARFSLECIDAIRANVPDDFPVFMRVVAQDDNVENGLTVDDIIEFCKLAKAHGVDIINVSRGNSFTSGMLESPPIDMPQGFNVENAAKIKQGAGMPVVAVGRINTSALAESIIAEGKADMVVMGRAHLADPEFCNKAIADRDDDIIHCVGCNQGCNDIVMVVDDRHICCMRNPATCREREFALVKTDNPKRVLVAGGGLAGMEAAITLKQRGHEPILIEQSEALGGQFALAGVAPRKAEMLDAALSRAKQAKKAGVDIRTSTAVTPALIDELKPDEIIFAVGAHPIIPNIPGIDDRNAVGYVDVLKGNVSLSGKAVVIGGGLVGLEVAEFLADKGCAVTVIEMLSEVGGDLGLFRKICVMDSMGKLGVDIITDAACVGISDGAVAIEKDGNRRELPCDHVVLAVGSKPNDISELQEYCQAKDIPCHLVGDAKQARKAMDAIFEAATIARAI